MLVKRQLIYEVLFVRCQKEIKCCLIQFHDLFSGVMEQHVDMIAIKYVFIPKTLVDFFKVNLSHILFYFLFFLPLSQYDKVCENEMKRPAFHKRNRDLKRERERETFVRRL